MTLWQDSGAGAIGHADGANETDDLEVAEPID